MSAVEVKIVRRKLVELKNLEVNARYMTAAQFNQLVANLKTDGVLTSTPLIYRDEILSGNHRVKAAIAAGIEAADTLEIVSELTQEQKVKIQLAHNAIAGQDDPNTLAQLYSSLGLDAKKYSGLTDDHFKLDDVDIAALSIGNVKYQELVILFLPEEEKQFMDQMTRLQKDKRARNRLIGRLDDFDTIFSAITKIKSVKNIHNSAVALRVRADIALEQLAQEESRPK
jgi:hypothetical protein